MPENELGFAEVVAELADKHATQQQLDKTGQVACVLNYLHGKLLSVDVTVTDVTRMTHVRPRRRRLTRPGKPIK